MYMQERRNVCYNTSIFTFLFQVVDSLSLPYARLFEMPFCGNEKLVNYMTEPILQ